MTTPIWPRSSPTPHSLKIILWILLVCALGGPFLQKFGIPVQYYLGLSPLSLEHGFVWTLLTYPFSYPAGGFLDLIFHLGFDLVLLWFFGSALIDRMGTNRFLILFFGSTLCGGLAALGALYGFSLPFFAGPSPALLALYTSWAILHSTQLPQSPQIRPILVFWLFIGGTLCLDLIGRHWPSLIADVTGALFGYFFCIVSERATSAVRCLRPLEECIHRLIERFHIAKKPTNVKVIDFQTGQPILDDDPFMDAMLARISLYGEHTLTPTEKARMQKISEKKSKNLKKTSL